MTVYGCAAVAPADAREPIFPAKELTQDEIAELRAAFASTRSFGVLLHGRNASVGLRNQCIRIVTAKLMSHCGYTLANPDADILELKSPRARAWVSLARDIVDAINCANKEWS
ncbi:hypothetical protein WJ91_03135 [Burkholderia ubonensis]|nr:hypothetical protein WJ91_03135 [Burkholderia ubonensis]